jgi:hypothetical protein
MPELRMLRRSREGKPLTRRVSFGISLDVCHPHWSRCAIPTSWWPSTYYGVSSYIVYGIWALFLKGIFFPYSVVGLSQNICVTDRDWHSCFRWYHRFTCRNYFPPDRRAQPSFDRDSCFGVLGGCHNNLASWYVHNSAVLV